MSINIPQGSKPGRKVNTQNGGRVFIPGSGTQPGRSVHVPKNGGSVFVPGTGTNPGQYVYFPK